jgi:hypothetical protein
MAQSLKANVAIHAPGCAAFFKSNLSIVSGPIA